MDSPQLAKTGRGRQCLRVLSVNKKHWKSRGYRLLSCPYRASSYAACSDNEQHVKYRWA